MSLDAASTTAIIRDTATDKQNGAQNPVVPQFSDNDTCYKCTLTLTTLKKHTEEALVSYNFSEAQNVKGNIFIHLILPFSAYAPF